MNFLKKEYGSPKNLNCVLQGTRLTHALGVGHVGAPGRAGVFILILVGKEHKQEEAHGIQHTHMN